MVESALGHADQRVPESPAACAYPIPWHCGSETIGTTLLRLKRSRPALVPTQILVSRSWKITRTRSLLKPSAVWLNFSGATGCPELRSSISSRDGTRSSASCASHRLPSRSNSNGRPPSVRRNERGSPGCGSNGEPMRMTTPSSGVPAQTLPSGDMVSAEVRGLVALSNLAISRKLRSPATRASTASRVITHNVPARSTNSEVAVGIESLAILSQCSPLRRASPPRAATHGAPS